MSPSRAGSSWKDFQLGSVRGLFPSARKKKSARKLKNCVFFSWLPLHFQKTTLFSVLIVVNNTFLLKMTNFLVQKSVKARKNIYFELEKLYIKKFQLGFSSKIEMLQLVSAQNLYSSVRLSSGNSSSNSSLVAIFNISSVVEFQRWWVLKSKVFAQKSTWSKENLIPTTLNHLWFSVVSKNQSF